MKATLVIPRPTLVIAHGPEIRSRATYRFRLRWTDHHPASHYGSGVILAGNNEVLDGLMFRYLRDRLGAWIDCDDPPRIAHALSVPWQDDMQEPGIGSPGPEAPPLPC